MPYLNNEEPVDNREELIKLLPENLPQINGVRDPHHGNGILDELSCEKCLLYAERRRVAVPVCESNMKIKAPQKNQGILLASHRWIPPNIGQFYGKELVRA